MDLDNYNLAAYVGMAVNASTKHPYPKKAFLAEDKGPRQMTDEEMDAMARKNTVILGGKIRKNGTKS